VGEQRVIWVQLESSAVTDENVRKLQAWVDQGGVLWIDTELANQFELVPLWKARSDQMVAEALVAAKISHAVLEGLKPDDKVGFSLPSGNQVIAGLGEDFVRRGITPLLGWPVSPTRGFLICAVRSRGRGTVIFRPRQIDTSSAAGRRFEENLRSWSFRVAPLAKPEVEKKGR
jgi:hypothetical protein